MAPDPNAFHGSYTSRALDCNHVIYQSVPSALEIKLSRPADTYSEPLDWEDEYPPVAFECVSANTLLCPKCEEAMRVERAAAARAYALIWADGYGDWVEGYLRGEDRLYAAERYRAAAAKVANFEGRMADRTNTISQTKAKAAREQAWEAKKKASFAVEEGEGAGEELKKQKALKSPIILARRLTRPSRSRCVRGEASDG
jgi:hypothetical protein